MKYFNTEGQCSPGIHYMVNLDQRLKVIKERYIERGCYFIISRGRQYGKTTTLNALERYLKEEYIVLALDFQLMGTEDFADEASFVRVFANAVLEELARAEADGRKDLYAYTSGYPVLVSAICKCISEELPREEGREDLTALWSKTGVEQAVAILLKENMSLFESMAKIAPCISGCRFLFGGCSGRGLLFSAAFSAARLRIGPFRPPIAYGGDDCLYFHESPFAGR